MWADSVSSSISYEGSPPRVDRHSEKTLPTASGSATSRWSLSQTCKGSLVRGCRDSCTALLILLQRIME